MKTKIYTLCGPDGRVRYVGKTSRPLALRLTQHVYIARKIAHVHHRDNWIRSLIAKGIRPVISLLIEVVGDGCAEERSWIETFKKEGFDLVNSTLGGEGVCGFRHSEETKKKWSAKRAGRKTGKPIHPNALAALAKANYGIPKSAEARSKISQSLRGRHLPSSTREKISAAHKGRIFSEEHRRRISAAKKGTVFSNEWRSKLKLSHSGKVLSDDHKRAIGEAMQKRRLTPEHKAKIGAANRRKHASLD